MNDRTVLDSIYAGQIRHRWQDKPASAIAKQTVAGMAEVTKTGLTCDAQADLAVHGGADKALHYYPAEHYAAWQNELNRMDLTAGGFGENLSAVGLTEGSVCIGDVFEIGSITVQISQGRQPCWKLNAHTGEDRMAYLFRKTARTGWYFRVLTTGHIQKGDQITLQERPNAKWTVERVTDAVLSRRISIDAAAELAALPEISDDWRSTFEDLARADQSLVQPGSHNTPS